MTGCYRSGGGASYAVVVAVCAGCGELTAEGARFCSACGAAVGGTVPQEVRKTVTVLFSDVAGSTSLGEQLDPESLRHVIARYFEVARECLERHGGTVEKFIGDAVMGVFGVPTVHEDDALRALRAAAELRAGLVVLNEELEVDVGVSLQLRIGVNTGEVVTGTEERLATGDAINVAARLEQAARPGEILIGEQTLRLAHAAVEVEPVESLSLKGKVEPVGAHRLIAVVEGASSFERRFDVPLVGRSGELAGLRAAFDGSVAERCCRLATVLGPPGIGKSRLVREFTEVVNGEATVLSGRCLPYGEGITFWPFVEIFREAEAGDELAAALPAGTAEDVFWSVRKALERRARERPLVLVVDDIHWAEPTLLDLLEHLALWTRDAPLLLLCLARPEFLDARPTWGGEHFVLAPLSDAESALLIEELLGGGRLDDATLSRIREVAEGNPLFVEQLLALLAEGGDAERVPPTIRALLAARLDGLPADEQAVLEHAAVIGLEFDWKGLGELTPDRRRPSGAQLAALVRKELIRPHEAIEDSFRFRHMLIRDAAYERIPKGVRADLHERFARWLDGRSSEFDELVGYHLEQARRYLAELGRRDERAQALAEEAAEHLGVSGQRAYARGDIEATVNLLRRAVDLLPVDASRRLSLLPTLGRALRDLGQMEAADAALSEAVERAQATGDRVLAADARISLAELRLHRTVEAGVTRADVLREVDAAIRVFEEARDNAGLARALTLEGSLHFWGGDVRLALLDYERAVEHARAAGDAGQEAQTLQRFLTAIQHGPTPIQEALTRVREIGTRAEANRRLSLSIVLIQLRFAAMEGRFDDARELVGQALALADDLAVTAVFDMTIRPAIADVELAAGDLAAAERELRLACEATERIGELGHLSSMTPPLIEVVLLQGRTEEALQLSERWQPERLTVPEDVEAQASWRRTRAKALARSGSLDEAERLAREAVAIMSATDYSNLHAHTLADLAEVLHATGQPREAAATLEEALRLFEEKGNIVEATRLRGLLAVPPIEA